MEIFKFGDQLTLENNKEYYYMGNIIMGIKLYAILSNVQVFGDITVMEEIKKDNETFFNPVDDILKEKVLECFRSKNADITKKIEELIP